MAVEYEVQQVPVGTTTTQTVAWLLNVRPATVRRWCRTGKLDAVQVGGERGQWRIYLDSMKLRPYPERSSVRPVVGSVRNFV